MTERQYAWSIHGSLPSTLAIVSRQGGEMWLTRDERLPSAYSRRRPSHAPSARGDHTGLHPVRATLFSARLAACPRGTPGCAADARGAHRDGRPAGDGGGGGAPLHDRSAGLEPGEAVGPPRESDAAGGQRPPRVPSGATSVLGADDPVERQAGRRIRAQRCYRAAVRSTTTPVIQGVGLMWVARMLLVPVPWS
jgi:hypothetical protein